MILPSSAKNFLKTNKLREVRFLDKNFPFICSVIIYGNKMAFFSFDNTEAYSMIIKSKAISEMFSQFFLFT